jgi:hypothetical protein
MFENWREFWKIAAVNLLILGAGLLLVELLFGTWFSSAHALYQFTQPRNVALVQENKLPGEPRTIRYTRDQYGFRGLDGGVGAIDVITVGGSTTDQRFLDDGATFQEVLKQRFAADGRKLVIANAGIDGQSTIGHINNFASWFEKIPGLHARFILYYVGINDNLRMHETEMFDRVSHDDRWLRRLKDLVREKSVLYQIYYIVRQLFVPPLFIRGIDHSLVAVDKALVDKPLVTNYATSSVKESLAGLQGRIKELASLTRKLGAEPIFVTQRSARWTVADGKVIGIDNYDIGEKHEFSDFGRVNGVDIYNIEKLTSDAIMHACADENAVCVDLRGEIAFDLKRDFYDQVHTTSSGAKAVGDYLYARLRNVL